MGFHHNGLRRDEDRVKQREGGVGRQETSARLSPAMDRHTFIATGHVKQRQIPEKKKLRAELKRDGNDNGKRKSTRKRMRPRL